MNPAGPTQTPIRFAGYSRRKLVLGAACLQLMLSGCDGEADANQGPPKISFVTFNTALIAQTENLTQRLDAIVNDIPNTNADVVCLQELWEPEQLKEVASKLRGTFPYSHWSVSAGEVIAGCDAKESDSLLGCLATACSNAASTGMTKCAVANCANAFTQVSTACQNCVMNHQTLAPSEIGTECALSSVNTTAYQDQSGILLLSKYPLKSKDYLRLESSFGDRGVLAASIESKALSSTDVYCTHLVATQTDIDYPGTHGSWSGERAVQIDALTQFIKGKRSNDDSVVLMGDLNCGPEGNDVAGEDPDGFARLIDSGLSADYVTKKSFECTFCADNPLVPSSSPSLMLDHVLFSNLPKNLSQNAQRIFGRPITIQVDGKPVETMHSDHYGFELTLDSEN